MKESLKQPAGPISPEEKKRVTNLHSIVIRYYFETEA